MKKGARFGTACELQCLRKLQQERQGDSNQPEDARRACIKSSRCRRVPAFKAGRSRLLWWESSLVTIPNPHADKDECFWRCKRRGKIQRLCYSRKGTERGFPTDWKANKNMHAAAADNRDSDCESGLARLEIQCSAHSVWARVIEK